MNHSFVKRMTLKAAFAALAVGIGIGASTVQAQEKIVLRLQHFASPVDTMQVDYLMPWAKRIHEQSNGRIEVQLYPAMQLGGSPVSLYSQAADGVVDIVWTVTGYTIDRFPKTGVFHLPFMVRDMESSSLALTEYVQKHAADEFEDTQVLAFYTHVPGVIHSRKPVRTVEDMRRLKVRTPSRPLGDFVQELGGQSMGIPFPGIPEAVSKGVVDAVTIPFAPAVALRLHEMVSGHTNFAASNGEGLYATAMLLTMNRKRYESLPEDLRKVIDDNSGPQESIKIARNSEASEKKAIEAVKAGTKNEFIEITDDQMGPWREAADKVAQDWIKSMTAQGHDGQALFDSAKALVEKHWNERDQRKP